MQQGRMSPQNTIPCRMSPGPWTWEDRSPRSIHVYLVGCWCRWIQRNDASNSRDWSRENKKHRSKVERVDKALETNTLT
eukprot:scaffold584_cov338-Pavlova_lutheri.AAC.49